MIMTLLDLGQEIMYCSVHLISLTSFVRSVLSSKDGFSRFVKLQLSDFAVGWVNWDWHLRAVLLVSNNFLNMDAPSSSVDGQDLTSLSFNSTFFRSAFNENSVALSYWNRFAVIFGLKFFAQSAAHHLSSHAAWGGEVSLS